MRQSGGPYGYAADIIAVAQHDSRDDRGFENRFQQFFVVVYFAALPAADLSGDGFANHGCGVVSQR